APRPSPVPATLTISQATSGIVFELELAVHLHGTCQRCLTETAVSEDIHAREYQAADPGDDDELRAPYVGDEPLDLDARARHGPRPAQGPRGRAAPDRRPVS